MEVSDKYLVVQTSELRKLIAGREQFGSLEALCIDLCGGVSSAGRMLYRLLNWWTKSNHPEGWVYKDYGDWYRELRISQKELTKANAALALAGVEVKLLKGRLDCPRKHYRLTLAGFVKALARVLIEPGAEWLKNFCEQFAKSITPKEIIRNRQKGKIEIDKSATPSTNITTDSSSLLPHDLNNKQQVGAADFQNEDNGTPATIENIQEGASAFEENARHGSDNPNPPVPPTPLPREVQTLVEVHNLHSIVAAEYVEKYGALRAVKCAEEAIRRGHNPAGLWRYFLDTGWYLNTPSLPAFSGQSLTPAEDFSTEEDAPFTPDEIAAEIQRRASKPEAATESEHAKVWRSAFAQLEVQLDKVNFETWLRDTTFIGFEDNTFIIGVRHQPAVQMLTYRLNRVVQRVVEDVVGAPVGLRFEVKRPKVDADEDEMPLFKLAANPRLYKLRTMTDEELTEALNAPVVG